MNHLRQWGLLWGAAVLAILLVGSSFWTRWGVMSHVDELATIHANYLWSERPDTSDLEYLLDELHPLGVRSVTRIHATGLPNVTVGEALDPDARAPSGPTDIGQHRFRAEWPEGRNTLVVEYHPMLAMDLGSRANRGLALSVLTAVLLLAFVWLWIGYRRRLEALAQEADQTRHLAHLGTLSAVIAHELRNPLTVLLGHVQLLREDLPDNRSLRHVESGAMRLDTLLSSLLKFARTGELSRDSASPRLLLERAAGDAGLPLSNVTGDAPEWSLDAMRVGQVLTNLLSNAVAAASPTGVWATVGVEEENLVFTIRDEGEGIPKGMHDTIFEPFHTTRTQGTGLGLAVARDIIVKHGGTLTAHDGPEGGAVFIARIPS